MFLQEFIILLNLWVGQISSKPTISDQGLMALTQSIQSIAEFNPAKLQQEMRTLNDFYQGMNGPNWNGFYLKGKKWNFEVDSEGSYISNPCADMWYGVKCAASNDTITSLNITSSSLTGSLPTQLTQLSSLQKLDLPFNSISGSIPPEIANLVGLNSLSLNNNFLTGTIPTQLGMLTALQYLRLRENRLSSTVPTELGLLARLITLHLFSNKLTGSIPKEFGALQNIANMQLHLNPLSGTIPSELALLNKLVFFTIFKTQISGTLPSFIGGWTGLTYLGMSDCRMSGTLPSELGRLSLLKLLRADSNLLVGSIPSEIGGLRALTQMSLYSNSLSGRIPEELSQLSSIQILNLKSNQLIGQFRRTLAAGLRAVQALYLEENGLSGYIPTEIGLMSNLTTLYLSSNAFSGSIPVEILKLKKLAELRAANIGLSGRFPTDFFVYLPALASLALDNNALTGQIPSSLGGLQALSYLGLYGNEFVGRIPTSLCHATTLKQLRLNSNSLSGTVPHCINRLTALWRIEIHENSLTGTIPMGLFSSLTRLKYVDLSTNLFFGEFPHDILQVSTLEGFIAADNAFSGGEMLFLGLARLQNATQIILADNQFSASLPPSMNLMSKLKSLDLSNNMLHGSLPSDLGGCSSLGSLQLNQNHLSGIVPGSICGLSHSLITLGLSANKFQGSLPSCLNEFSLLKRLILSRNAFTNRNTELNFLDAPALTIVDISMNAFQGTLPGSIFINNPSLRVFAAASNCFHGSLPEALCAAQSLDKLILDGLNAGISCRVSIWGEGLSKAFRLTGSRNRNQMSGTLPSCIFEAFPNISSLHVSGNRLEGSIPSTLSSWPARLQDLSLSYNKLVGSIPSDLQAEASRFQVFDLSHNALNGLIDKIEISETVSESMQLDLNRFSGRLSQALTDTKLPVRVLQGNLISCTDSELSGELPVNDAYLAQYRCGSNLVDRFLYAFVGLFLAAMFFGMYVIYFRLKTLHSGGFLHLFFPTNRAEDNAANESVSKILDLFIQLRKFCAISLAFFLLVLLPLYTALHFYQGSVSFAYLWTSSAAYKSGVESAAIMLMFWVPMMIFNIYFYSTAIKDNINSEEYSRRLSIRASIATETRSDAIRHTKLRTMAKMVTRIVLIAVVNFITVMATNMAYVFISVRYAKSIQLLSSVCLSVFKQFYQSIVLPRVFKSSFLYLGLTRVEIEAYSLQNFKGGFIFELVTRVLNAIVYPAIALTIVDSSCFEHVLYNPPPVSSSYTVENCRFVLKTLTSFNDAGKASFSVEELQVCSAMKTSHVTYNPSFSYSFQCSATLLNTYTPVFLLMALFSTFGEPIRLYVLRQITRRCPVTFRSVLHFLPRILQTPEERLNRVRRRHNIDPDYNVLDFNVILMPITQDLALLLSFGIVSPFLAIVLITSLFFKVVRWHHLIAWFVRKDVEQEPGGGVTQLIADCKEFTSHSNPLFIAKWFLSVFASLFLALFLEDTAGSVVGMKKSVWAPVLMLLLTVTGGKLVELWVARKIVSHASDKAMSDFAYPTQSALWSEEHVQTGQPRPSFSLNYNDTERRLSIRTSLGRPADNPLTGVGRRFDLRRVEDVRASLTIDGRRQSVPMPVPVHTASL